ncbi:cysteine hydrolase family protein [Paeniglutamicibacter kerguelensis]|uniref:Nicotinamidase-related amidase n=1 Tax=Paeniglutamicibacter kerguelensis TaxID=254788 RepID=A0ABS4XDK9_9MICC|nr:isochorismatase family cysteine hydrolase [Paeniglutamicibacter kerguelensis]MBP2386563.1 nicotinamidase-related amidase [Paeniglutamicibacter kerguelensis]
MSNESTAVVFIEFQNDFTSPGGVLHDAVKDSIEANSTLDNAAKVLAAARENGATVIHAPISFAPGYNEISSHPYGILKGVVDATAFVKGQWGAEIDERFAPVESDIVIEGKRGLDAFGSTNLDFILRSKGIRKVALAGFLTNCCVESTMRTAYERGFEVVTLTDAVAATSVEEGESAVRFNYPMFSTPATTDEFISTLESSQGLTDTSRGY